MPRPSKPLRTTLGDLQPDIDETDDSILGFFAICPSTTDGPFKVCFPDIEDERSESDWLDVIRSFDEDWGALLGRIVAVRAEVEKDVVELHSGYFPKERFGGSPSELISHFRLKHVNYYGTGEVGLWYEGDAIFHCLDLNVELDKEWRVQFVNFDG